MTGTLIIILLILSAFLNLVLIWRFLQQKNRSPEDEQSSLDEKLEYFSSEMGGYLDARQLWRFVARFCQETFGMSFVAIVTLRYDIEPYQIDYNEGFQEVALNAMLQGNDSPVLEAIESHRHLINRFDYPPTSELYRALEKQKLYLMVPILKQRDLLGIIFLGGEHQTPAIPPRSLHALKLISTQVARALGNIQTVQTMVQAQKMAGIGMLTSQLAHDFKSFIALTKLQNRGDSRMVKQASYMEKMVQDLLNYSGPQELHLTAVDINRFIDMSMELVDIPEEIQVERHYSKDLPMTRLDIGQMRRVFQNLLENSVRAMRYSDGKRLKITTRTLRPLSKFTKNLWVYIEILDEGTGIQEEFLERIFDPFFTTYKREGGNGLGLAIVKQIIDRHSGHIDVSSRPGKATIFNIRLPYQGDLTN